MPLLYDTGILLYGAGARLASLFNQKAKAWVWGRRNLLEKIGAEIRPGNRPVWFHFASVGEFEQGRPLIEALKEKKPDTSIVITFFSPSGYNLRKNYALADHVFYLPADTAQNARNFIELVQPSMAIFTKYEFWYHYFNTLHNERIPLYLISAIFRKEQIFFKWYGAWYRDVLKLVSHFFVQDTSSKELLGTLGVTNVTVSGDTRFDRVFAHASQAKPLEEVACFCGDAPVLIAGSTWFADEQLLAALADTNPDWKLIIAPHETGETRIQEIERLFKVAIRYSSLKSQISYLQAQTLIIDNVGMLSSLYQYGKVAYIGGGFGKGIHNTLEAAAYGLAVIFGPNYSRFREATELIAVGAGKSISSASELIKAFEDFKSDKQAGQTAAAYVRDNTGATKMILDSILSTA